MARVELSGPQTRIWESGSAQNLCMLGQGSGKTYLAGLISGRFVRSCPGIPGFIAANTYRQLNDSTLKNVRKCWRELFGWEEWKKNRPWGQYVVGKQPPDHWPTDGHDFKDYGGIISFWNGTYVFIGSLDNYMAHDGKEFGWAILDETKDTKEEAITDVIMGRLRIPGLFFHQDIGWNTKGMGVERNPMFVFTTPAKVDWLNEWFNLAYHHDEIIRRAHSKTDYFFNVDQDLNQAVVIASTYHNEKNLRPGYIKENFQRHSEAKKKMLVYAIPFAKSGNEFYKSFELGVHGNTDCPYDPDLPIHISYDFNVAPYMTLTCYQIRETESLIQFTQIDEFCLESPMNSTKAATTAFCKKYGPHNPEVLVYGDPSGKQKDTRTEQGRNDFQIISDTLRKYGIAHKMKQARKAPGVIARGNFINAILENSIYVREKLLIIQISRSCKHSISDLMYVKEDDEGKKKKERVKDPDTGQTYEKYGHCSDSLDYAICKIFESDFLASQGKKKWSGASL